MPRLALSFKCCITDSLRVWLSANKFPHSFSEEGGLVHTHIDLSAIRRRFIIWLEWYNVTVPCSYIRFTFFISFGGNSENLNLPK